MTRLLPTLIFALALGACSESSSPVDGDPQATAAPRSAARPPNLIVILLDDFGCDWLSSYDSAHPTPRIDALAAEGVRFENAWATPLCAPSRVQLLTGRYPLRTGWTRHHDSPRWGGPGLDPATELSFAQLLREAGYATGIAGKWQLNDLRDDPELLSRHGFDSHAVWVGVERGNPPSGQRYWDPYLQVRGRRRTHTGRFGPDVLADFAADFLERNADEPFLLYYPMVLAHAPLVDTPAQRGLPEAQRFAAMVSYADGLVGRLIDRLHELSLAEDTVVLLTADNGSAEPGPRADGRSSATGKARFSQDGVRVPLIAWAPGLLPREHAGTSYADLVDLTDVLPTLLELAGASPPAELELDGRSFATRIRGEERARPRGWIFSQLWQRRMIRDAQYLLIEGGALHDLELDPLQRRPLEEPYSEEAALARRRLVRGLRFLPRDAAPPFEGYGIEPGGERDG